MQGDDEQTKHFKQNEQFKFMENRFKYPKKYMLSDVEKLTDSDQFLEFIEKAQNDQYPLYFKSRPCKK